DPKRPDGRDRFGASGLFDERGHKPLFKSMALPAARGPHGWSSANGRHGRRAGALLPDVPWLYNCGSSEFSRLAPSFSRSCKILMKPSLVPGVTGEAQKRVVTENLVSHHNPRGPAVLATPYLLMIMEYAAYNAIAPHLDEGEDSVGVG